MPVLERMPLDEDSTTNSIEEELMVEHITEFRFKPGPNSTKKPPVPSAEEPAPNNNPPAPPLDAPSQGIYPPTGRGTLTSAAGPEDWSEDYRLSAWWGDKWQLIYGQEEAWPQGLRLQGGKIIQDGLVCVPASRTTKVV